MPGANSRFTGSATRWNSFTPSSIFHGSVAPFGVTTGRVGPVRGRPVGRRLRLLGAAACALLATAPARSAPDSNRFRRVMLMLPSPCEPRADGALEIGARDPVVAHRLDVLAVGVDLVLLGLQQLIHAEQHRVVVLLRERDDPLAQRHQRLSRSIRWSGAPPAAGCAPARTSERMAIASASARCCAAPELRAQPRDLGLLAGRRSAARDRSTARSSLGRRDRDARWRRDRGRRPRACLW